MNKKVLFLMLSCYLIVSSTLAQKAMPVVKATSDQVAIRDGVNFEENAWTIMPEYKPDIYTSSNKGKSVTFYTDIDSISFQIEADVVHDFIILLNEKDTAYTQIQYQPSYLEVLTAAEAYNLEDETPIPNFTYQESSHPKLVALREDFQLDSIAGTGNEVSKILNLLHWIHDLILHDGNSHNPTMMNAMDLIQTCKKEERGLNCRGLATVLNECYLAMDIPSRFVTCMPKDSVFDDCHVINMVYAKDLQKWLWIDPTNNAYVINEKGELLSIEEVRERLINGETLILNPDANWNRRYSTEKEYYLDYYMAKNLYRFQCPLNSEYDYETKTPQKEVIYVELLPLDGFQQTPKFTSYTNEKSEVTYKVYKTNDPNAFWTKPTNKKN